VAELTQAERHGLTLDRQTGRGQETTEECDCVPAAKRGDQQSATNEAG
jgi:hypothetical protein